MLVARMVALILVILCLGLQACTTPYDALFESIRQGPKALSETIRQGQTHAKAGRYEEAIRLYHKALELGEREFGPDHATTASLLDQLAGMYLALDRYEEAEPLLKRALAIKEKALEPDHPLVANTLSNLAVLYWHQGRYEEAEPLDRRALAIREKAYGPDHLDVANSLNNLAGVYIAQGRYEEVEPLYKRALAIKEKARGPESLGFANSLNNLASLYRLQGRYEAAESLLKRALAIMEKVRGPDHLDAALSLNNLARIYRAQGRYEAAGSLLKRALTISERTLGPDHSFVAMNLNELAVLYHAQGRYEEAEPLLKRALAVREKAYGPGELNVAQSLKNLAVLYHAQGRDEAALGHIRRATAIHRARAERAGATRSTGALKEQARNRFVFLHHVDIVKTITERKPERRTELFAEAFEVGQLAQASSAAGAVARMGARFAAGDDALAETVRDHQDAVAFWQKLDADLIKVVSAPSGKRNPARAKALRKRLDGLDARIKALSQKLAAEFPKYAELAAAKPVPLGDVQKLLNREEALIAYLVSDKKTFVWAIRRDRAELFVADVGREGLRDAVDELRGGLDASGVYQLSDLPPFNRSAAHKLFEQIFAPAEKVLDGARHVFVVADGALQSLPLGVLVTEEPKGEFKDFSGYRQVPWLAKKYALTTLPSVSSLRALRTFAKRAKAHIPFTGFGDPLLKGHPGSNRGIKLASLYRGAIANVDAVRDLPPLPDTADELRALSAAVNGDPKQIYLREKATERTVKSLDLSNSRIIAFATHALVAGDLTNAEPALVLTPPEKGTALDDGLLTASEVAQLKLNADLVILSACNTAAGDDSEGAEGLSGLAKAFFYAGSRALLVSHWPVVSDAAVKLTTGMLRYRADNPTAGRAEALRQSMLALMNNEEKPHYAHPLFWAPFVVVGEGGTYAVK